MWDYLKGLGRAAVLVLCGGLMILMASSEKFELASLSYTPVPSVWVRVGVGLIGLGCVVTGIVLQIALKPKQLESSVQTPPPIAQSAPPSLDDYFVPRPSHAPFTEQAKGVEEIWMVAKRFDSFLHDNAKSIVEALRKGTTFRFLMHDPANSDLMKSMAQLSYSNRDYAQVQQRLHHAVEEIGKLDAVVENAVELRLTQWCIPMGYTFFGPQNIDGTLYVEHFGYKITLNERLGLLVPAERDPALFKYHRAMFLSQWKDAKRVAF
jgi:hypothetical protein